MTIQECATLDDMQEGSGLDMSTCRTEIPLANRSVHGPSRPMGVYHDIFSPMSCAQTTKQRWGTVVTGTSLVKQVSSLASMEGILF